MTKIDGKNYKWNDDLQQYELVEFGRHKKELKMKKIRGLGKIQVMAEPINDGDVCLFFNSMTDASKKFNVAVSTIFNYIKNGNSYKGYVFKKVEEKIDDKCKISVKNDLENMAEIISALKSGKEVYRKKKSGGDWELVNCGMCDFVNYDYRIGYKCFNVCVSIKIDESLKHKLDNLVKSKGTTINALFKDKLKEVIIKELKDERDIIQA